MKHARLAAALVPLAVLSGSCSLVYDGSKHTDVEPVPVEELCDVFGDFLCRSAAACCGVMPPPDCGAGFAEMCRETTGLGMIVSSPLVVYDADAAGRWAAEASLRADTCDPATLELLNLEVVAPRFFGGRFMPGEDCSRAGAVTVLACESPYVCTLVDGATVCAEPRTLGESCLSGFDCAEGYCDLEGTRTCVARHAVGEPCTSGNECDSFACDDRGSHTCLPPDLRMLWGCGGS